MCKICWCSGQCSPGEGRNWPWEAPEMWLWPSCSRAFPFFNPLAPGQLCGERGSGTGLQTDLSLAAKGSPKKRKEMVPCVGCCGWWASLQLPPAEAPLPAGPPPSSELIRRCSDRLTVQTFVLNKKLPLLPFFPFDGEGWGLPASVQEESLILSYLRPIFAGSWGLSWNQINPPNPMAV